MHTRAWIGARLPLANAAQFLASPRLCRTHSHRRSIQAQDCWSNTAIATGPQHVRVQANTLGLSLSVCRGKRGTALVVTSASGNGDAPANDTWLVVGLGNPGAQYEDTRHNVSLPLLHNVATAAAQHNRPLLRLYWMAYNQYRLHDCWAAQIGFKIIDCLSAEAGVAVTQKQHNALVGKGRLHGVPVLLAKPTTFMNSSGKAVRKLMDYYKVSTHAGLSKLRCLGMPCTNRVPKRWAQTRMHVLTAASCWRWDVVA
jgi:Peptidyl-tRNA hydrolase